MAIPSGRGQERSRNQDDLLSLAANNGSPDGESAAILDQQGITVGLRPGDEVMRRVRSCGSLVYNTPPCLQARRATCASQISAVALRPHNSPTSKDRLS